jgi:prepilin-type N-terminal cleavage/methylation domain-containing protein
MKKSLKGFTLVEIMIVVAIIGIIIAIAVPAFLRARENSRGRACQENLAKIDGSKEQYGLEFKLSNGASVTLAQLIQPGTATVGEGYLKKTPTCPANGTYTTNVLGTDPTCSYVGPTWAEKHQLQ